MVLSRLLPRSARTTTELISYIAWPIAIMTVLQRVLVKAVDGARTDDFSPVYQAALAFLNRRPVYTAHYEWTDPHYLYAPSGTLLMAPLAVIDPERARWLFIGVNAIAILAALYLLLRLFGKDLRSPLLPVVIFAAFASETVTNTLVFTNINGLVLLGEVLFLTFLLARRDLWAGAALGLTLSVKPVLAPLLVLALVRKQWGVFVTALGIPIALNIVAWPLSVDAWEFVRRTVPYLGESRDYFNSAIVGNGAYLGLPEWLVWSLRIVFGLMVVASAWLLYRYYRHDDLFFVTTGTGLLLTAAFLLGSLGQMYYSMLLFPLLIGVLQRNSVMRNWPAWLAAYGFLTYDSWWSGRWPDLGRTTEYLRSTLAWSLLVIVIFAVLLDRYVTARREGRLDRGIDPVWVDDRATEGATTADGASPVGAAGGTSTLGGADGDPDVPGRTSSV